MEDSLTICLSTNTFKTPIKPAVIRKEPQYFTRKPPQDFTKNLPQDFTKNSSIVNFQQDFTKNQSMDGLSVIEFDEQHKRKSQAGILGNSIYLDSNLILGKLVDTIGTLHVNLATLYKKLSDIYAITSKVAAKKKKILKNANSKSEIYGERYETTQIYSNHYT